MKGSAEKNVRLHYTLQTNRAGKKNVQKPGFRKRLKLSLLKLKIEKKCINVLIIGTTKLL